MKSKPDRTLTIVNILFMAARMVYCSIISLTLELNIEDDGSKHRTHLRH